MYGVTEFVFFQAEDGIRDLVRSGGLGDVYKRQAVSDFAEAQWLVEELRQLVRDGVARQEIAVLYRSCLLYTSDAADERSSVDLGGGRII